jgi:hypothetical protein
MAAPMTVLKGDCECCDNKDVTIRVQFGMKMCEACIALQAATPSVDAILEASRTLDTSIRVKPELFVAATTAIIELKGSIDHDENIPAEKKDYVMTQECFKRFQHFKQVVSEKRQELLQVESELRAWQANAQEFAGKLAREDREKFKALDISYDPQPVKQIKTPKAPGRAKPTAAQFKEAASKYNLNAMAISMTATARNMSADEAAQYLIAQIAAKKQATN